MFDRLGTTDVDRLIARKAYDRAIDILRREVEERPKSLHHRQKLADVLALAGRRRDAGSILLGVVDTLFDAGFWAQAVAVLKKIERIDPDRAEVGTLLADVEAAREEERASAYRPAVSHRFAAIAAAAAGEGRGGGGRVERAPEVGEILADLDPSLGEGGEPVPEERLRSIQGSPLFSGLDAHEIGAVIRELRLRSFAPGDIVVTEGELRRSMFLIAGGTVRVFVRQDDGGSAPVRELGAGDFFGEISLIRDTPRTATATAATACELLELGLEAFRALAARHPQVGTIVEEFCRRRSGSAEEQAARVAPAGRP